MVGTLNIVLAGRAGGRNEMLNIEAMWKGKWMLKGSFGTGRNLSEHLRASQSVAAIRICLHVVIDGK
jgi:hypothetical protein